MTGFATGFISFYCFTSSCSASVQMLCSYQQKYCLRESLLDTLSCQNDPIEVTSHFQKPSKGAVAVYACVFRYICPTAILQQRNSVLVCSTPCMLALCSLMEPWGAPPRLVLLILMIFSPFHTLWFLRGPTAPAWMLLNSAV